MKRKITQQGPLISVIMSTFREIADGGPDNGKDSTLARAIESVVRQSYQHWELLVLADHPPDQDVERIEALIASYDDDRIRLLNLAQRGGADSPGVLPKRVGVRRSSGELLAFLDADNEWTPHHLELSVKPLQDDPELDLVYCDRKVSLSVREPQALVEDVPIPYKLFAPMFGEDLANAIGHLFLPYQFLGSPFKEEFASVMKMMGFFYEPLGPLYGEDFSWIKPDWSAKSREKLKRYNLIDMSEAVMRRDAYQAAGGIRESYSLDWRLWKDMMSAERGNFKHLHHIGLHYRTSSLDQHREHFALTQIEKFDLPFDMHEWEKKIIHEIQARSSHKHEQRAGSLKSQVPTNRSRRKRVLFVGEAAALSHVARPLVLARALESAKYEVFMASDPRYDALLGDRPFNVIPMSSLPLETILSRQYAGEPIFDVETLDRYVQQDLRILRRVSPDIVVGDIRWSLAVSSRLFEIPYINIASAHWSPYASVDYELAEHPMIHLLGEPLAQMIFAFIRPAGFAVHSFPLNLIRLKYGLPPLGFDLRHLHVYGDYTVYPDVQQIIRSRQLPSSHLYLGPILWSPQVESPDWWSDVPDDRPVIYVSLGSTGQPALLSIIVEAVADLPISVMAATASRSRLESVPPNVYLADYLPGLEAAGRSQLVICNGGAMSSQQALATGAPVLGVVSNMDQLMFAKAVSKIGAGETLREGEADGRAIRRLVRQMLSTPAYRESAQRIAGVYKQTDAANTFRQLVDAICH